MTEPPDPDPRFYHSKDQLFYGEIVDIYNGDPHDVIPRNRLRLFCASVGYVHLPRPAPFNKDYCVDTRGMKKDPRRLDKESIGTWKKFGLSFNPLEKRWDAHSVVDCSPPFRVGIYKDQVKMRIPRKGEDGGYDVRMLPKWIVEHGGLRGTVLSVCAHIVWVWNKYAGLTPCPVFQPAINPRDEDDPVLLRPSDLSPGQVVEYDARVYHNKDSPSRYYAHVGFNLRGADPEYERDSRLLFLSWKQMEEDYTVAVLDEKQLQPSLLDLDDDQLSANTTFICFPLICPTKQIYACFCDGGDTLQLTFSGSDDDYTPAKRLNEFTAKAAEFAEAVWDIDDLEEWEEEEEDTLREEDGEEKEKEQAASEKEQAVSERDCALAKNPYSSSSPMIQALKERYRRNHLTHYKDCNNRWKVNTFYARPKPKPKPTPAFNRLRSGWSRPFRPPPTPKYKERRKKWTAHQVEVKPPPDRDWEQFRLEQRQRIAEGVQKRVDLRGDPLVQEAVERFERERQQLTKKPVLTLQLDLSTLLSDTDEEECPTPPPNDTSNAGGPIEEACRTLSSCTVGCAGSDTVLANRSWFTCPTVVSSSHSPAPATARPRPRHFDDEFNYYPFWTDPPKNTCNLPVVYADGIPSPPPRGQSPPPARHFVYPGVPPLSPPAPASLPPPHPPSPASGRPSPPRCSIFNASAMSALGETNVFNTFRGRDGGPRADPSKSKHAQSLSPAGMDGSLPAGSAAPRKHSPPTSSVFDPRNQAALIVGMGRSESLHAPPPAVVSYNKYAKGQSVFSSQSDSSLEGATPRVHSPVESRRKQLQQQMRQLEEDIRVNRERQDLIERVGLPAAARVDNRLEKISATGRQTPNESHFLGLMTESASGRASSPLVRTQLWSKAEKLIELIADISTDIVDDDVIDWLSGLDPREMSDEVSLELLRMALLFVPRYNEVVGDKIRLFLQQAGR